MNLIHKILIFILTFFYLFQSSYAENIPVLTFHSIDNKTPNYQKYDVAIGKVLFQKIILELKKNHFYTITLDDFNKGNINKSLGKPILLTFDDGFMNFYDNAYPFLKKEGYNANIGIITSKIGNKGFLGRKELKIIANEPGFSVVIHTSSHKDLTTLSFSGQLNEIKNSKIILEKITGKTITSLFYPYGKTNNNVIKIMQSVGITNGFSNQNSCYNTISSNKFKIERIRIDNRINLPNLMKKLNEYSSNNKKEYVR